MELKISEVQIPERISFNYEELKAELVERMKDYETAFYSDSQIKQAKSDRAALNRLKKALNDERIRREREYMKPFEEFKNQVNEIIAIIDKPVALIDKQVKEYEEKKKGEKLEEIRKLFEALNPFDWLELQQMFDKRWLNASYKLTAVREDLEKVFVNIQGDMLLLSGQPAAATFMPEMVQAYAKHLSLQEALEEGRKLVEIEVRRNKREEKKPEEQPPKAPLVRDELEDDAQVIKTWVNFSALLTVNQAMELRRFFEERGISFKAI